mmetsp:Transcript_8579/g.31696  ORF Transcript_8579/g.31696 Transcript_8579/m.31696 type:complete len:214 (-) Transcript_8579:122-763(-)
MVAHRRRGIGLFPGPAASLSMEESPEAPCSGLLLKLPLCPPQLWLSWPATLRPECSNALPWTSSNQCASCCGGSRLSCNKDDDVCPLVWSHVDVSAARPAAVKLVRAGGSKSSVSVCLVSSLCSSMLNAPRMSTKPGCPRTSKMRCGHLAWPVCADSNVGVDFVVSPGGPNRSTTRWHQVEGLSKSTTRSMFVGSTTWPTVLRPRFTGAFLRA